MNIKTINNPEFILKKIKIKNIKQNLLLIDKKIDFLIRKSGTENLIRIMVQSHKESYVNKSIKQIVNKIKQIDE